MREIRPVTSDRRGDRFARLGVVADGARQMEQLQRPFQIEIDILGDRGALGILALTQLDIGAEPPRLPLDRETGFGVLAQRLGSRILTSPFAALGEATGIFALGLVGASDERAEPATPKSELALAAVRAEAGI